ncbi:MAG: glycosyltransferase family 4 protein [Bacteroidota bacterium]
MNVFYTAGSRIPSETANSVHVMKMSEAFAANGVSTTLLVPNYPNVFQIPESPLDFYGIEHPFELQKITRIKSTSHIFNWLFAYFCTLKIRKSNKNVLMTRHPMSAGICILLGIPTILELHNRLMGMDNRFFRTLGLFRKRSLLRVVVISQKLKSIIQEEYGLDEHQLLVLPDGVTMAPFEKAVKKPLFDKDRLQVTYIGSLYKGRGIELIIEMAKQDRDNDYHIYGGREREIEDWRKYVLENNLDNVVFHGFIPNKDVPQILCQADVLLMPYQKKVTIANAGDSSTWMSPMKMFEYMASGRLVMSSDMPVLREVLTDDNSILLPSDQPEQWVKAIRRISQEKEHHRAMAQRAYDDVQQYTWKKRAEKLLSQFQQSSLN